MRVVILSILFLLGCDFFEIKPKVAIFRDIDGNKVVLGRINQEQLYLIHFWASWCASCMEELPSFLQFRQMMANSTGDFKILLVAVSDEIKRVKKVLEYYDFQSLMDPLGFEMGKFGVLRVPATILVNQNLKKIPFPDPANLKTTKIVQGARKWDNKYYVNQLKEFIANFLYKKK
ncbi:MAG: TlpA family protein disulfide reductase [Deltaproteobacteria bacterium]|nr:TlpA family protein disulfide reductase [Deltaproteobacteria bacterium]MCX7953350.1 TlpA family protein disulfide reductase [Deltaproteobacteria bacterium]